MSLLWKFLIGVAVALPVTAVISGMVAASSVEDPAPREPIVIDDGKRQPEDDRGSETRNDDEGAGDDEIDTVGVRPEDLDDADDRDDRDDRRVTRDGDGTDDGGDGTDDRSRSSDGED